MAIAERLLAERFNRPGFEVVNHRVWGFVSDGDLMEGVASEAASHRRATSGSASSRSSTTTITSPSTADTALSFTEDVGRRFEAYGWQVLRVADGNDLAGDRRRALGRAGRRSTARR